MGYTGRGMTRGAGQFRCEWHKGGGGKPETKGKRERKKGKTLHGLVWDDIYVESKRSENEKFYALYPTHK